ncbi:MAG: hypothetical protein IPH61_07330 [Bacteroidetes bacterium]|nr:hypothetical protein [Bacteroidota bacterium]
MKVSILIFIAIFFSLKLYTQDTASYYGNSFTPKGNLHVLIVFVGFDTTTIADSSETLEHDKIPDWAMGDFNGVIDKDNSQIHTIKNVTSYLHTMSNGAFTITREIYPKLNK